MALTEMQKAPVEEHLPTSTPVHDSDEQGETGAIVLAGDNNISPKTLNHNEASKIS